ncbi:MAG: PilZ domain-containing protein [Spirochaetales bacterium]|nr:PilZ domain-containing protein [Spirochaetales bacterium]
MEQKRAHTRKSLKVEINCLVNFGKDSIAGLTYNISGGGICLISKKPLHPGSTVDLDFSIPFSKRIVAVAEVKWNKEIESQRYSNGLQFMSIKEEDLELLKNYLLEEHDKDLKTKKDRRKNERVNLGVFVNYMTIEAYAVDISEAGIRIAANEKLEEGQEIQLMFFLPDLSCVMVSGVIKWCKKTDSSLFEFGIQFVEPHEKDIDSIKKYVKKNVT